MLYRCNDTNDDRLSIKTGVVNNNDDFVHIEDASVPSDMNQEFSLSFFFSRKLSAFIET